ncbi:MAG: methionyl-tRNA formyltransferase [Candidatus Glassbacteria bacterium]|nr:methionyl-tRNA formyltransferase [Candidatus Glassbacteria bacterium]
MRVIFWGSPQFAAGPLEEICKSSHEVAGVVCQPDRPSGRGRKLNPPPVKRAAERLGLAVLQPERPRGGQFLSDLRSLAPDISVVVAYGHILRPEIFTLPPYGSINLHASLLPAWRGAAPIQRALAAGDTASGLTVIRMDEGMDSGEVLAVKRMAIGQSETSGELAARMSAAGGPLLVETLDRIERGEVRPVPQDHSLATFAPKIDREEARVDWSRPAREIANSVRAFDPAPGAWTTRDSEPLKLFRPRLADCTGEPGAVAQAPGGGLLVCCGQGALEFAEVQAQGKRRMPAADYLRGAPVAEGEKLE